MLYVTPTCNSIKYFSYVGVFLFPLLHGCTVLIFVTSVARFVTKRRWNPLLPFSCFLCRMVSTLVASVAKFVACVYGRERDKKNKKLEGECNPFSHIQTSRHSRQASTQRTTFGNNTGDILGKYRHRAARETRSWRRNALICNII